MRFNPFSPARRARRQLRRDERRRRGQRLQWKLTRSYMLVTVAAVCIIEVLGGLLGWWAASRSTLTLEQLMAKTQSTAARVTPFMLKEPENPQKKNYDLTSLLLTQLGGKVMGVVLRRDYVVVASTHETFLRPGDQMKGRATINDFLSVRLAKEGTANQWKFDARGEYGEIATAVPIRNSQSQILGVLWTKSEPPLQADKFSRDMLGLILLSGIIAGIFAAIVGTGFGFITARRYTRRLQTIADAAGAWSSGDFKAAASDTSKDEIGQLAQGLNDMAGKLQELVDLRQNLASSEERNRLARDLHDTVKQQLFATTMQIGAARALMQSDAGAAEARLVEAERQAYAAQQELTAILEQMRPGSYLRQGAPLTLEQTIRDAVDDWTRQSGIGAEVQCQALPELPENQRQALLRILQEALSNIARHSGAARVQVEARMDNAGATLRLAIADNGRGLAAESGQTGMGLRNMRERSEALPGGKFWVLSKPGEGTHIETTFNCRQDSDHE